MSEAKKLPSGKWRNLLYVGKDENGQPKSAFIRGCNSTWRGDAEGSQKKYGKGN